MPLVQFLQLQVSHIGTSYIFKKCDIELH